MIVKHWISSELVILGIRNFLIEKIRIKVKTNKNDLKENKAFSLSFPLWFI